MAKNLDTTLVRIFIVTTENASITMTVNTLHLTRGIISQQIKWLEDAFERCLLECDDRRLKFTHIDERFLDRIKCLLVLSDKVWVDMVARPLWGLACLGVSYDLVGTVFLLIFKVFTEA